MKKLSKITLIEEPRSEEMIQRELEEVLGGWNCGTFSDGWFRDKCKNFNNKSCTDGSGAENYCIEYSKHI